ncbi:MAG: hypothetical protein ABI585_09015 [Betaproteobacteria bacterium]
MTTLVFQSYRTHDVPRAIECSMASVRTWAASRGHDYRFLDDAFFDVLPAWYREKAGDHKLLLANLARLVVARNVLAGSHDRAIWIDADVVVFDPAAFDVVPDDGFAFCLETWVERVGDRFEAVHRVNNAVCAFDRGNAFLDYAIWAHERLVRDRPELVQRFGTSTALLTMIFRATPLPLVHHVGLFTPAIVRELAVPGDGPAVRELALRHGHPMHAANLTYSMVGQPHNGVVATAQDYDVAVDRLIATGGAALDASRARSSDVVSSPPSRGTV